MTTTPLVIFGASGLAREFHDVVEAVNSAAVASGAVPMYDFLGFIDRDPNLAASVADRGPFLGSDSVVDTVPAGTEYIIAIAEGNVRERLDTMMTERNFTAATLIHPSAWVGPRGNRFGDGTVVCANASVTTAISAGRHVHIHVNATVGHDAELHDYVSLLPSSSVSGNVAVGRSTTLGTGARILQGLTIGEKTVIGAGAVVTRSLPSHITVVGVPARVLSE